MQIKSRVLALAAGLLVGGAAQAALVTINFDTINSQASYTEAGFTFTVVPSGGNHTDAFDYMYFHDGGNNPGNVELTMTFGGAAFSLLSFDYMYGQSGVDIVGSDGTVVSFGDKGDFVKSPTALGLTNVTSAVFRQGSNGYFVFDNLVVDTAPARLPGPASLALVGAALAGVALSRRRKA